VEVEVEVGKEDTAVEVEVEGARVRVEVEEEGVRGRGGRCERKSECERQRRGREEWKRKG